MSSAPLVSAIMVTRDRGRLSRRSLACLAAQTWPALELVVVDDGHEDYGPLLEAHAARLTIRYLKLDHDPSRKLGALRNLALTHARGELIAQWDDDEWYHPQRLSTQVEHLQTHALDAVELRYHLMHLNLPRFASRPFRCDTRDGMPGTIVHRRTQLRYPNLARSEDLAFERAFRAHARLGVLGKEASHLMVRCYHGENTWDRGHFERRLRRGLLGTLEYARARFLRGDLLRHAAFRLDEREGQSVRAFLEQSRALGLLCE